MAKCPGLPHLKQTLCPFNVEVVPGCGSLGPVEQEVGALLLVR